MNSTIHSEISVRRRKGQISDYNHLHDFMDSSKEAEASNKHRFLTHTMFFIKQVMIPIYGFQLTNSSGKSYNLKDMLEQDHVAADYGGKFIPTLSDFTDALEESIEYKTIISDFQSDNRRFFVENVKVYELMMAPLHLTGQIKSLFATHNSWFVGFILPKIFNDIQIELKNFNIAPAYFFNKMDFKSWMQNGRNGVPPSFEKIAGNMKRKSVINIHEIEQLTKQ